MKKRQLIFIFIILITSFFTFSKGLKFAFLKDDWNYLWVSIYEPKYLLSGLLLHPATNFEFFLLARLFGTKVVLWQFFGLLLKIIASFCISLLAFKITKSKLVSFLSGVFFASSALGIEAVVWPSAHVVNITVIFLCSGLYFWIAFFQKNSKESLILTIIFLLFALFSDPWRSLPVFVFLILSLVFFTKTKIKVNFKYLILFLSSIVLIAFLIFFWQKAIFLI